MNWIQFAKLNFLTRVVSRKKGAYIIPYRGARVKINPRSRVHLNANLHLNFSPLSKGESYLLLDEGAVLTVMGSFTVHYNCDIAVHKNAVLTLGSGFINAGSLLGCSKAITIGKGATIARDVVVMDSDSHQICDGKHVVDQPVVIGDHVWLGTRSMVMKGVRIGDGAIVAAGSIVTKDVASRSIVAGVPAKCVRTDVDWK